MSFSRCVRESLKAALLRSRVILSDGPGLSAATPFVLNLPTSSTSTLAHCTVGVASLRTHAAPRQLTSLRGFAAGPPRAAPRQQPDLQKRVADQGMYLVAIVVGMVGLTYASVPLYRMFCQATGFGGTVKEGRSVEEKLRRRDEERDEGLEAAAAARELTITFNADVADGLTWKFAPTQRSVRIHPGQSTLAFYTAHNLSEHAVTGVSTYNVAPQQAGQYFNKVQCFCFEEQRLRAGEKVDMPVFFYIDPEFATDPRMRGINNITLSYTFLKVAEDQEEEEAEERVVGVGHERVAVAAA